MVKLYKLVDSVLSLKIKVSNSFGREFTRLKLLETEQERQSNILAILIAETSHFQYKIYVILTFLHINMNKF